MAPTINKIGALLRQLIVRQQDWANLADLQSRSKKLVEKLFPLRELICAELALLKVKISKDMLDKGDVSVDQSCGLSLADQGSLKGLQTFHYNFKHES